jgi:hypothetical protein
MLEIRLELRVKQQSSRELNASRLDYRELERLLQRRRSELGD